MPLQSLYNNTFGQHNNPEKVAEEYPYFSLAHFFHLKQAEPSNNNYQNIAAKTALHFANPYWLNHQLNATAQTAEETIFVQSTGTIQPASEAVEEKVVESPVSETAIPEVPATPENTVAEEKHTGSEGPLLFEPLHTTDYFASQGIRLSEVILSNDKMGRQLKSFTEWLKTMKKVHPDGLKEKNEGFIDPSVQKMAENSNKEEDVITESMADVYLQQGKTNNAKEIYEKLSLLNPSKSAYFAAKLNEIQ